jgi:hypothetical protein
MGGDGAPVILINSRNVDRTWAPGVAKRRWSGVRFDHCRVDDAGLPRAAGINSSMFRGNQT